MKGLDELVVIAWMLFGIYMLVFFLVIADLCSGVRKAKQRGEMRSSYGYRKTINKIARYYNALLALTIMDCMQMGCLWYLHNYYECKLPIFPFVTLMGALGIGFIEIKSIYEKAEDKIKNEYQEAGILVAKLVQNKTDPEEIAKVVVEYMNKDLMKKQEEMKDERN